MSSSTTERSYHHGDAAEALLNAADQLLATEGMGALSLRAIAREAGLSHAAPKNHFGDLSGLLSELAARGFYRMAEAIEQARAGLSDANNAMDAIARAYVGFAREHTGLFLLMYRGERLDFSRPSLQQALQAAAAALNSTTAMRESNRDAPLARMAASTAAWCLVHGYAMLLIDKRLNPMLARIESADPAADLLNAVLASAKR